MLKGQGTFDGEGKHAIFQTFIAVSMWNINYKLKSNGSNKNTENETEVQVLSELYGARFCSKLNCLLIIPRVDKTPF